MGQDNSKFGFPSTILEPGTYRIVNVLTSTAIESPEYDRQRVVSGSSRPSSKHQQWFVQRVGKGYQFKNCHSGAYLTAQSTDAGALVCGSEYPMSWVLHLIEGDNTFVIQVPMNDRVINLHNGQAINGNKINIRTAGEVLADHRKWRFEYVSEESDTVDVEHLEQDLLNKNWELSATRNELEKCGSELAQCRDELAKCCDELAKSHNELANCRVELANCRAELADCRTELAEKEQTGKKDSENPRPEVAELGGRGGPLGSLKRMMNPKSQRDTWPKE